MDSKAQIFDKFIKENDKLELYSTLWAMEQIKSIHDPTEAAKKFKELQEAFKNAYSES